MAAKRNKAQASRGSKDIRSTAGSVARRPVTRRQIRVEVAKKLAEQRQIVQDLKVKEFPLFKPPATIRSLQVKTKYLRSKSYPRKKSEWTSTFEKLGAQQACEVSHAAKKKIWTRQYQADVANEAPHQRNLIMNLKIRRTNFPTQKIPEQRAHKICDVIKKLWDKQCEAAILLKKSI